MKRCTRPGRSFPLITSYHWNYMNGDWYPEGSIGSWNTSYEQPRHNYRRAALYQDIRTYIFNNTIDSNPVDGGWANIPEFLAGSKSPGPLEAADHVEDYGRRTLASIDRARLHVDRGQKEFACTEEDMRATGELGLYYAEKLRGAGHLARFLFFGGESEHQQSEAHLARALDAWHAVVAATENHYVPHEVWLFGQFHWNLYTKDVENDIRIARDAKPFPSGSTYALDGMHEWLEYTYRLLGRTPAVPAVVNMRPVFGGPLSVTPPMAEHEDPASPLGQYVAVDAREHARQGDSITGARPSSSGASSAMFQVELPADGEYHVSVDCWWPKAEGSVVVFVDENGTESDGYPVRASSRTPLRTWTRLHVNRNLPLGAGTHDIRIFR